jgi:fatty-acyl-CoA synthase
MPQPPLTTSYWPAGTSAPVLDTTAGGILRAAAGRAPDQPALVAGDPSPGRRRQWSYAQLLAQAERAAHALRARFQRPKAAVLTHRALTNNARLAAEAIGMRPAEALVNPMPLVHIAGCGLLTLGLVQTLGTHVVMPRFDPGLALELTETYRGACTGGGPAMLTALPGHPARAQRDLSSVRYPLSGGATVPADLVRQAEAAFGIPFAITFAQTESSCSITMTKPGDTAADRAGTLGQPLPQTEVKITGTSTGQTVPCGTAGEICTRGYLVMDGYPGDPQATAATADPGSWLHTGDLGSMDPRGYCRIEGRIKEIIIRGGENIYPRGIEAVLLSHPAVTGAAVAAIPDRFWGEVAAAAVSTSAAAAPTAAELAGFCRARLAARKVPVRWLFTDAFPRPPPARSARTCSAPS